MSIEINKTKFIPLRWLANICGDISGWAIMRISYQDELEDFGWRYKLHSFIWKMTWPVYYRFGTMYAWDFTEDNYWEETGTVDPDYYGWDFEDNNGDAFRVIYK